MNSNGKNESTKQRSLRSLRTEMWNTIHSRGNKICGFNMGYVYMLISLETIKCLVSLAELDSQYRRRNGINRNMYVTEVYCCENYVVKPKG